LLLIIIIITLLPRHRQIGGMGCCFLSITRKRLDRFAWNFQRRCGVTMGWPYYIFGQFRGTTRCHDV